jgi:hypothetical protein
VLVGGGGRGVGVVLLCDGDGLMGGCYLWDGLS